MRLTTPHGISSPPFRFQGELCLWLLKKCYPCLRYTCYLCLQSIHPFSKGGNFLGCGVKVGLITPLWKRGGRGDLLMISRKRLHPVGNTGLINAIELLGLSRRLKNGLFVLTHSELFPDRQEHIDMLFVRRAMCFPVRKIIPRESEIFDPEFTHACRMATAEIGEQAVVLIPLAHRHRRPAFQPSPLLAYPAPGIERRARTRNRLGLQHILGGQLNGFPLSNNHVQMAML